MTQQKYIRHSKLGFFTWPDMNDVWHKHLAEFLVSCYGGKIISAGFVQIEPETNVLCFGKSESLDIRSLPEDAELYEKQIGEY